MLSVVIVRNRACRTKYQSGKMAQWEKAGTVQGWKMAHIPGIQEKRTPTLESSSLTSTYML